MKRKFSAKITEDGSQMLLFDDRVDSLFSRTSFHEDLGLSNEEKKELGKAMLDKLFSILENRDAKNKEQSWDVKCAAFKDALKVEVKSKNTSKVPITWLMTTILGISQEEASIRYEAAEELFMHPDFKDKRDLIVDKIYLKK